MSEPAPGLRIAHVQPHSMDLFGHADEDVGTHVRYAVPDLAAAQARLGDRPRVHLVASGRPGRHRANGVEYVFHRCVQPPRAGGVRLRYARQLSPTMLDALDPRAVDVVHFHGARNLHAMYAAIAWGARRRGLPLLAHEHGYRAVGRIGHAALRYALRRTGIVIAGNDETAEAFVALGVPPDAVRRVPNGVDRAIFTPGPARRRRPEDPLRILVVARLAEDKDPWTTADGLAALAERGRRLDVTIVGDGPYRPMVERRLADAGVTPTFLPYRSPEELAELYRQAEVLLLTSLSEGCNQVTIEAMACGLPVVASDIAGIRENIRGAGVLVPPADPDAVATALAGLADDPAALLRCRERGLARASALDWSAIALRIRALYAELLRDRPRAG